jgi:hypothetical protein
MSDTWSRRMTSCIVVFAVSVLTLFPEKLSAQGVQEGKWKVASGGTATQVIYYNGTGNSQTVTATACSVSGGQVKFLTPSFYSVLVAVPDCFTASATLPNQGSVSIELLTGTGASGTYQVSVLP